jgi:hypothetical protein
MKDLKTQKWLSTKEAQKFSKLKSCDFNALQTPRKTGI